MRYFTRATQLILPVIVAATLTLSGCGAGNSGEKEGTSPNSTDNQANSATGNNSTANNQSSNATPPASSNQPKEYEHSLGKIELSASPERIVAPYLEDALITLGIEPAAKWSLGDLVQDYLEPYLQNVPKLDFTGGGMNMEALLETNPGLVVLYTTNMVNEETYKQYSSIAPTYVFEDATVSWKETLRVLGDMTGTTNKAEQAIQDYDTKVAEAVKKLEPVATGKTFAVVRAKPKEIQLMDGSFYSGPVLYSDLGLTPHKLVKEWSWGHAVSLSLEKLPELDADYIFILVQGDAARPLLDEFQKSPLWQNLPAVKNGHAFEMPSNYWMASGAIANTKKIDDVLEALVK